MTSKPVPGAGQEILYLDDEKPLVYLISRMLQQLGYRATGFTVPDDAVQSIRANPRRYALAVLDYNMPETSGLDVAQEILKLNPSLPIAIASGYISDELRTKAKAMGINSILFKPSAVEDLANTIQDLLSL